MKKVTLLILTTLIISACSSDSENISPETVNEPSNTENSAPIIASKSLAVAEHSTAGTIIGTISATDADDDQLRFTLTSDAHLEINENTGVITVGANLKLDFEKERSVSFTVAVFDGKITTEQDFILDVQDVDEMNLLSEEQLELIAYFKLLTLWRGPNNTPITLTQKWGESMNMYLDGTISTEFEGTAQNVIAQFNSLTEASNFDIGLVNNLEDANAHVFFGEKSEVEAIWPDMYDIIKEGDYFGYAITPSQNAVLISTRIWVSSAHEVLFKHELAHSLGFGHSDKCDDEKSFLCSTIEPDYDILPIEQNVIRYLYHSEMTGGLSESEVDLALANIMLNEQ